MKRKNRRIKVKVVLILVGICFLICLMISQYRKQIKEQPVGEGVSIAQADVLMQALWDDFGESEVYQLIQKQEKESFLTYEMVQKIEELAILKNPKLQENRITKAKNWKEKYEEDFVVQGEDWHYFYDRLLEVFDQKKEIQKKTITILGNNQTVTQMDGTPIAEKELLTGEGILRYENQIFQEQIQKTVLVYQKGNMLLAYCKMIQEEDTISNAWIVESAKDSLRILSGKWLVNFYAPNVKQEVREQVADISLQNGAVTEVLVKKEKINGKLLTLKETEIEIEGKGSFVLAKDVKVYQLFGTMREASCKDLAIGYSFTDFIVEHNEVIACLITKDEAMETIRVLLKTNEFASEYHQEIAFIVDSDVIIQSGEKQWEESAGKEIKIDSKSEFFAGNRIKIIPKVLTAKTTMQSIKRSQGIPVYRGSFEIERKEQGLLLVNELLLEEYLYAVVPSEMPASYPVEALKAQAICARTYAYRNMKNPGLPAYGANVDDSVGYQVYHNILENSETTKAVKDTKGQVILYGEELAGTYYYSTSCGFGTNAEVWNHNKREEFPYLKAKRLGQEDVINKDSAMQEKLFSEYISKQYPEDLEYKEGWYRWDYQAGTEAIPGLEERIKERQKVNPELIGIQNNAGQFEAKEIGTIGTVKNILVCKRNEGGIAEELLIEGSKEKVLILKEYNIRYVLSDRISMIKKQNQEMIQAGMLLPSAYFIVKPILDKREVVGYSIRGGGYGHGVGMSQNGAKAMAEQGKKSEDIICFFYDGVKLATIY